MAYVTRVESPEIYLVPSVKEFLREAFPAGSIVFMPGYDKAPALLVEKLMEGEVILGSEGGRLVGMVVIHFPDPEREEPPQISHFFNKGSADMRRQLIDAGVEIMKEKGYIKFWTCNFTGRPDSVWARTFKRAGKSKKLGSLMEVEFE